MQECKTAKHEEFLGPRKRLVEKKAKKALYTLPTGGPSAKGQKLNLGRSDLMRVLTWGGRPGKDKSIGVQDGTT